jgi:hypothetical protein
VTARGAAWALVALLVSGVGARAQERWIVLFDGRSTGAWRAYRQQAFPDRGWTVENGALRAVAGAGTDIVTKETFGDFELELEWRVSPGGNSGVFYRVTETGAAIWETSPESQVLDDAKHPDGRAPRTSAGSLYGLLAPVGKTLAPVGEWNRLRIVARGALVEHWLNGVRVVRYEQGSAPLARAIARSKFATYRTFGAAREGHVGLQHHGDDVWFRNVRIRRLDSAP